MSSAASWQQSWRLLSEKFGMENFWMRQKKSQNFYELLKIYLSQNQLGTESTFY